MPLTGRQLVMERLKEAIRTATTGDLQRAAMFLEGAKKYETGVRTSGLKLVGLKQLLGKRK